MKKTLSILDLLLQVNNNHGKKILMVWWHYIPKAIFPLYKKLLWPYFKAIEILNILKHALALDITQWMCNEVKHEIDLLIREEISVVILLQNVF